MAHMPGVAAFFIILGAILLFGVVGWIIGTHLRARRLGLPQPTLASYNPFRSSASRGYGGPSPAPGGIGGWFSDKWRSFKNRNNRSAGGAYEENLSSNIRGGRSTRGFGPLDPDDAWDTRVGTEADAYGPGGYEEEQELGLHQSGIAPTPIHAPPEYEEERGRALNRAPGPYSGGLQVGADRRYDEAGKAPAENPFDDAAEPSNVSLRGVSPRPVSDGRTHGHLKGQESIDSAAERRSLFREEV
jgi:hypothetical protein